MGGYLVNGRPFPGVPVMRRGDNEAHSVVLLFPPRHGEEVIADGLTEVAAGELLKKATVICREGDGVYSSDEFWSRFTDKYGTKKARKWMGGGNA